MNGGVQRWIELGKDAWGGWNAHKVPRLAAAIAYGTIFAIAPLLIVTIAIAGFALGLTNGGHGHHIVEDRLLGQIAASAGPGAADAVRGMITASFDKPRQGTIAQVVGWIAFILGASGFFAALQDAFNTIWEVEPPKSRGWLRIVRDRVASFGMVLGIGFLLLVTFAVNAALSFVTTYVQGSLPFPGAGFVFGAIDVIVSLALVTGLFAAMYKVLPDVTLAWSDVMAGAIATAVLFVVGQSLIGVYLGRAGVASAYGAAGSLLALLLWIYYSALTMLFGAEVTRAYAKQHGTHAPGASASSAPTVRGETGVVPTSATRPLRT